MAENGSKRKAVEIETHVNIVTTFVSEKKNFQWNIKHFDVIWHMMMKDRASEVEKQLTFKFASGEKVWIWKNVSFIESNCIEPVTDWQSYRMVH
jgi:hypothetical protein